MRVQEGQSALNCSPEQPVKQENPSYFTDVGIKSSRGQCRVII